MSICTVNVNKVSKKDTELVGDKNREKVSAVRIKRERRRRGIVNAIARKYNILVAPDLLEALLNLERDPVEVVGEVIGNMREDEVVLTIKHFEVD